MARGRLNIKRSIALFLVAVLLSSACFTMALYAAPPEGEEINRIGYTNSANGSYLRSQTDDRFFEAFFVAARYSR